MTDDEHTYSEAELGFLLGDVFVDLHAFLDDDDAALACEIMFEHSTDDFEYE